MNQYSWPLCRYLSDRAAASQRWPLGVLACLLVLALAGCKEPKGTPSAVPVRTKTLGLESAHELTRFSASVEPRQKIDLSFRVPGTVESLFKVTVREGEKEIQRDVQEGDVVPEGAELARLDQRDYRNEVELGRAKLESAEAQWRDDQRQANRLIDLFEKNAANSNEKEEAITRRDTSAAAVSAARTGLKVAQDRLADTVLRVPIANATVVRKQTEPAERIRENQPVFQIMDLSRVHAVFGVPDIMVGAGEASVGQTIDVFVEALSAQLTGEVTKLSPAADVKTRTFLTEVTISNKDGRLKPGMIVTIAVGQKQPPVMLLPMAAIHQGQSPDELMVYEVVNENGRDLVKARRVALGGIYNNQVEVLPDGSDVHAGSKVVLTTAERLTDGAVVRVVRDSPDSAEGLSEVK
jgi:RND family efflux transporter MFP subunit